jgi:signal transduction histidine kinase/DNA-binding response OmpR family regulator
MTRLLIILFCWTPVSVAIAQTPVADSLKMQLDAHPISDTLRVNLCIDLSFQYQWINFDVSLKYAEEALKVAESLAFQRGIATASFRLAHCLWALGDSDRAIEKGLRAVSIAEKNGFIKVKAETYRILAVCYRDQQDIRKAVWYIRQAEVIAFQERSWDLLARVYNLAGVIESTREKTDSAFIYYKKALTLTAEHPITKFHVSQALSNIGELYVAANPDKAFAYFERALASAKETHNKSAEAGIMANMGRASLLNKRYRDAERYLKQSLMLSRELGLKRVIRHAYMALSELNIQNGNTTEALKYMQAYYGVRDSLLNGSKTRQIVELEKRYESEKQQQKIQLLEQEKEIQSIWTSSLIIGSLLLTIALVIIYRLEKQRSAKARQLLDAQHSLNEKLKETDTMKSRFFANLSHEFRTPLSLILGPVEAQLRKNKLAPAERKNLTLIRRNADRLLALVNQLLDLSKLDAKKMGLVIKPGNLMEFAEVLAASFDSMAEHKRIQFVKNISGSEVPVGFDPDKVEKILSNILFNAFKFTPAEGKVIFSMYLVDGDEKQVIISVADTGKGIPAEEQSNVFSPFYQLRNNCEDSHPGTGLGLSLVNELVKLYNGTITLTSAPEKGTDITVVLPLFDSRGEPEDAYHAADRQTILYNTEERENDNASNLLAEKADRILVVEDNAALRNFIASGFVDRFTILMAKDGVQGLELARKYVPDIIISDVMMPLMNGLDFTRRVKDDERTSHIPVILLTAKADATSKIEGLNEGADGYLPKPFSMEELQLTVTNLVDQRNRLAAKLKHDLVRQKTTYDREQSLDEKFMRKVRAVVETNIGNSFFSVEMLAEEVNLSRAQLFRKLKALINTSPRDLINDIRLQRAAQLIRAKTDNVSQIGYSVGFSEQSYFAKRFRRKYGVSPSEYAET